MNTLNQNKSKKFATGWLIVVACMLIQAIPFGVASNIQPQFVSYVVEEKGFTLAGFSLIFTLGTIVSAVASPFIGMMFNKISAKTMYLLGAILSGGGFLAFSMCQELWQFYIVAGIVQVGTSIISSIGIPLLINSWFDDTTKGKALGLAFAGSGLGNIFLQQMTAYSLVNFGSSKSYLMFGALSLIVGIPVSLLFLRMPKNNSEIVKGNKKENGKEESQNTTTVEWGYTFKEAKNLKFFWILALGLFFLAEPIMKLIFFKNYQGIEILRYLSLSIPFIIITQTSTSVLQASNHYIRPVINLFAGCLVKVLLTWYLVPIPKINIYGAVIASIGAYITVAVLNMISLKGKLKISIDYYNCFFKPLAAALAMSAGVVMTYVKVMKSIENESISCLLAIFVGIIIYMIAIMLLKVFRLEEIKDRLVKK